MGSKRAAVVPDKYKRRKVFAHRHFPKGYDRPGRQLSDLSDPQEAPLVEKEPILDPVEPSKPNNVARVEKKEKAGLLKVSAVRRFPRGLGKPDVEIPELSEPEEEEVETLNLEEKDPFLDWMESLEPENMEDEMVSEHVLKGSTDDLGFSDAEKRSLSETHNLAAKWRCFSSKPNNVDQSKDLYRVEKKRPRLLRVSAVRRFPRALGKPDEEIPELSELEEEDEEEEALTLEEKDPFLDRMESSEPKNIEDEMESEDVLKGITNGLGFSDAEKRFLSERYNLAKWRWVSAVRDFPTACGTNSMKLRSKQAVAKKPQFRKPVCCIPSKKIESELKGNNEL